MRDSPDQVDSLVALGFTELEAAVYLYLVENAPATGYRVSHDIGKPVANTYKAIESLHQKGGVMVDESGENRQVRAVPPHELLDQFSNAFRKRHEAANRALEGLEPQEQDMGVYTLTNTDQVVARARTMLEDADDVVLCDLFPRAVVKLRDDLEAAAQRGVMVAARVYEPTELEGAELVTSTRAAEVRGRWPGQWLNMVVDGAQILLSFLSEDASKVHQAVWSGSPFLSWVYHVSFSWEITGTRVEDALERASVTLEEIRELIMDFERIRTPGARGYRAVTSLVKGSGSPVANLLAEDDSRGG